MYKNSLYLPHEILAQSSHSQKFQTQIHIKITTSQ